MDRYLCELKRMDPPREEISVRGSVLIVGNPDGYGRALADRLRESGVQCILCGFANEKADKILKDESFAEFNDSIRGLGNFETVISLIGFSLNKDPFLSPFCYDELKKPVYRQFYLSKFLVSSWENPQNCTLFALTSMGGDFGTLKKNVYNPAQGGISGIMKCLPKENPGRFRVIDLEQKITKEALIRVVLLELSDSSAVLETSWQGDTRFTQIAAPFHPKSAKTARWQDFSEDDLVVVTGGGHGVTASCIRDLAKNMKAHWILLGRTPLDENFLQSFSALNPRQIQEKVLLNAKEKNEKLSPVELKKRTSSIISGLEIVTQLKALRSLGSKATYLSADVSSSNLLKKAFENHSINPSRIRAIIHGAGVLQDKLIRDKTEEQFDQVFSTKILGLVNLLELCSNDFLRFLCSFASVAGKFGNKGQSDYASANEVLNHIALVASKKFTNTHHLSINWGPLDGGMVTPELARMFQSQGVGLIDLSAGSALFSHELLFQEPKSQIVVGCGRFELGMESLSETSVIQNLKIDPAKHIYLKDHCLLEDPVLPMAMVMEFMARMTKKAYPSLNPFGIKDLKVHHGLSFSDEPVLLRLESKILDNKVFVEIFGAHKPKAKEMKLYSAWVLVDEMDATLKDFTPDPDLSLLNLNLDEIYDNYLFHGPSLRCIQNIPKISQTSINADLSLSDPRIFLSNSEETSWFFDPCVLDGMAQLGLVWLGHTHKAIGIPQGFSFYVQKKPFCANHVKCHLKITDLNHSAKTAMVSCWFLDENQEIVAFGEGWQAIFNESFNRYTSGFKKGQK